MDPSAQAVFSFGKETELNEEFFASPQLAKHASFFIQMIEQAIGLLGPNIELLTDILIELGEKHATFGVKDSHYPAMGETLY
jgi:hemoglobin-like flavoprotein